MPRTEKADRILEYLQNRTLDFPPTFRELQSACGISSTSVVTYNLGKLVAQGLVIYEPGKSRTIRLVRPARPAAELRVVIELPWVPIKELQGNARVHYMERHRHISDLRDRGHEYGLLAKEEHPQYEYPIEANLELEIAAWNPKQIDWENIGYSYKAFLDGLQVVMYRDKYGDVPGAGLIVDDKQFINANVRTRIGEARTVIVITREAD